MWDGRRRGGIYHKDEAYVIIRSVFSGLVIGWKRAEEDHTAHWTYCSRVLSFQPSLMTHEEARVYCTGWAGCCDLKQCHKNAWKSATPTDMIRRISTVTPLRSDSSHAGRVWWAGCLLYLAYMSLQTFEPIHTEDKPQLQRAKASSQRNLPVLQDTREKGRRSKWSAPTLARLLEGELSVSYPIICDQPWWREEHMTLLFCKDHIHLNILQVNITWFPAVKHMYVGCLVGLSRCCRHFTL